MTISMSVDGVTLTQSAGQAATTQAQQGQAAALQAAAQARTNADVARANAQLARDQIRDAIRNANDAVNGADVPVPPIPPAPPSGAGGQPTIVIPTDGGNDITIQVDGRGIHVSQNGHEAVIPIRDVVPRGAVEISYAIAASIGFIAIGWPMALAFSRWLGRRGAAGQQSAQLSAAVQARLDAMDRNIDTVAMEMERVSEGQRFTNKLLADRGQSPAPEYVAAGVRAPVDGTHSS